MPTVHRVSRSFLVQLGVAHPPRTANQIKSKLRRDPDYFRFRLPADEPDTANHDGVGHETVANSSSTLNKSCTEDENCSTSVVGAAQKSSAKDTKDLIDSPNSGTCDDAGVDVSIAEIVKGRRKKKVSPEEKSSTSNLSTSKMALRKRKASVLDSDFIWNNPTKTVKENGDMEKGGADHSTPKEIVGVRKTTSGRWRVAICSQGKNRYVGTLDTQDQAISVNEVARGKGGADRSTPKEVDFRTVGVRKRASGKWMLDIHYQGKNRYMGTFDTQDQAILANLIVRGKLKATKESKLTAGEMKLNVKLAKEAALEASDESNGTPERTATKFIHLVAKTSTSAKDCKKKQPIDSRNAGVYATASGKWKVELKYHRKMHCMGTYTWEHAVLVNEVARGKLEATSDSKLTADEIDLNVKLAKEAALEALSRNNGIEHTGKSEPTATKSKGLVAKTPMSLKDGKKTPPIDPKTLGVTATASGKWKVEVGYQSATRYMGTFGKREQAMLVNEVARGMLKMTKDSKLTAGEIERNVTFAKEVAVSQSDAVLECVRVGVAYENAKGGVNKEMNIAEVNINKEKGRTDHSTPLGISELLV